MSEILQIIESLTGGEIVKDVLAGLIVAIIISFVAFMGQSLLRSRLMRQAESQYGRLRGRTIAFLEALFLVPAIGILALFYSTVSLVLIALSGAEWILNAANLWGPPRELAVKALAVILFLIDAAVFARSIFSSRRSLVQFGKYVLWLLVILALLLFGGSLAHTFVETLLEPYWKHASEDLNPLLSILGLIFVIGVRLQTYQNGNSAEVSPDRGAHGSFAK